VRKKERELGKRKRGKERKKEGVGKKVIVCERE
jgi:hypothetical protein